MNDWIIVVIGLAVVIAFAEFARRAVKAEHGTIRAYRERVERKVAAQKELREAAEDAWAFLASRWTTDDDPVDLLSLKSRTAERLSKALKELDDIEAEATDG